MSAGQDTRTSDLVTIINPDVFALAMVEVPSLMALGEEFSQRIIDPKDDGTVGGGGGGRGWGVD